MDITQITDKNQLKALLYDRVVIIENAQREMRMLEDRLVQVQREEAEKNAKEPDTKK